jgi:hypothetical protein
MWKRMGIETNVFSIFLQACEVVLCALNQLAVVAIITNLSTFSGCKDTTFFECGGNL